MRDEDPSRASANPERAGVARRPLDSGHERAPHEPVTVERGRQVGLSSRPDPHEVTTGWVCTRRRELRAVGLQEGLVAGPILGAPHALRTLEDGAAMGRIRISGDGWVEVAAFPA